MVPNFHCPHLSSWRSAQIGLSNHRSLIVQFIKVTQSGRCAANHLTDTALKAKSCDDTHVYVALSDVGLANPSRRIKSGCWVERNNATGLTSTVGLSLAHKEVEQFRKVPLAADSNTFVQTSTGHAICTSMRIYKQYQNMD